MAVRILLAALLLATPALAQSRPEAVPRTDVAVTYANTPAEGPPAEMRIAFHAGTGTFRVDPPTQAGPEAGAPIYILSRRGVAQAMMVMESRQAFLLLDADANMLRDLEVSLASGRAQRLGVARFANIACTQWRLPEPALGQACISARGVLLRRETPQGGSMEAIEVDLRPQDAARFRLPDGFRAITLEEMFASPQ